MGHFTKLFLVQYVSDGPPNSKKKKHPQDNTTFSCKTRSDCVLSDWNDGNKLGGAIVPCSAAVIFAK
jgi:hypothetical protein